MKKDIYEGYDEEARAYFESLDYAFDKFKSLDEEETIPDDEWKLLEEAHRARLREENPPPQAFTIPKPSWLQRLLDWLF